MIKQSCRTFIASIVMVALIAPKGAPLDAAGAESSANSGNRWQPVLPSRDGDHSVWVKETASDRAIGKVCSDTTDTDCISSVWATTNGVRIDGTPVGVENLSGNLWQFPGVAHSHGSLFLASAVFRSWGGLNLEIIPVELVDEPFNGYEPLTGGTSCVQAVGRNQCLRRSDFPAGVRFGMTVRGSLPFSGFGIGRMRSTEFSSGDGTPGSSLSIEADPVAVPAVALSGQWSSLGTEVQTWFKSQCIDNFKVGIDGECQLGNATLAYAVPTALTTSMWNADPSAMRGLFTDYVGSRTVMKASPGYKAFTAMKSAINDTAAAMTTFWSMSFVKPNTQSPSCLYLDKGLSGLVATNALFFSRMTPLFDNEMKALVLDLAGPHYSPDGTTPIQGSYDLILRQDVANCLFALDESFAAPDNVFADEVVYVDGNTFQIAEEETIESDEVREVTLEEAQSEILDSGREGVPAVDVESRIGGVEVVSSARLAVVKDEGKSETTQFPSSVTRLEGGWFHLGTQDFTFSDPVLKSRISVVPARTSWCVSSGKLFRVSGYSGNCPKRYSKAQIRYCSSGKRVVVHVSARATCLPGQAVVARLDCVRKTEVRAVFGKRPRCPRGFSVLKSAVCINTRSGQARTVRAVAPRCVNGFKRATVLKCVKKGRTFRVTAVRPSCPRGSKKA